MDVREILCLRWIKLMGHKKVQHSENFQSLNTLEGDPAYFKVISHTGKMLWPADLEL